MKNEYPIPKLGKLKCAKYYCMPLGALNQTKFTSQIQFMTNS